MKKAQIHGQVFVYILTLIITAAILLYGYKAIIDINKRAEQVQLVDFKTKLRSDIETISTDYGSFKTKTYNVPSKVKEVCFYQKDVLEVGDPDDYINIDNPLIRDSISDTDNNVFLVIGNTIDPMELTRIEVDDGQILCIPIISNSLKLRLEGLGDGVLVKETS